MHASGCKIHGRTVQLYVISPCIWQQRESMSWSSNSYALTVTQQGTAVDNVSLVMLHFERLFGSVQNHTP